MANTIINLLLKVVIVLIVTNQAFAGTVLTAEDVKIYPIENSEGMDLSGLAECDGELYTVSDKDKNNIYALRFTKDDKSLKLEKKHVIEPPNSEVDYSLKHKLTYLAEKYLHDHPLDFEGITCQGSNLLILSENHSSLLRFDTDKDSSIWMSSNYYTISRSNGYLNKYNAFFEGVVALQSEIVLAIEREPRGLLIKESSGVSIVKSLPNNLKLDFQGRPEDLTGLTFDGRYLYTLERNASAVCKRDLEKFEAIECLNFREAENDIGYSDTRYGMAEGLALVNNSFYVVLDNNNNTVVNTEDSRGRLIKFKAFDAEQI